MIINNITTHRSFVFQSTENSDQIPHESSKEADQLQDFINKTVELGNDVENNLQRFNDGDITESEYKKSLDSFGKNIEAFEAYAIIRHLFTKKNK